MNIQHDGDTKEGNFFIENDGRRIGELAYFFSGESKFIIDHTEVDMPYREQGIGKELIQAAVDFAREKGFKILPMCRYAKSIMVQTPEYKDVLE